MQHINFFRKDPRTGEWAASFTQEWPVGGLRNQLSYTVTYLRSAGDAGDFTGFGDVALNYRYQLVGSGETKVAVAPRFTVLLPSGSARKELGLGERRSPGSACPPASCCRIVSSLTRTSASPGCPREGPRRRPGRRGRGYCGREPDLAGAAEPELPARGNLDPRPDRDRAATDAHGLRGLRQPRACAGPTTFGAASRSCRGSRFRSASDPVTADTAFSCTSPSSTRSRARPRSDPRLERRGARRITGPGWVEAAPDNGRPFSREVVIAADPRRHENRLAPSSRRFRAW